MLLNIIIYQICWLACILGGAKGMPLLGIGVVMLAAAFHLFKSHKPITECLLLLAVALVGGAWVSLLVALGWLVYPSGTLIENTAPYWLVALWVAFATTFNVSLRWFKQHLFLAATFGAIGGPLAYLAGERLGGVVFTSYPHGITALAAGWAILLPLLLVIARHLYGYTQTKSTTFLS